MISDKSTKITSKRIGLDIKSNGAKTTRTNNLNKRKPAELNMELIETKNNNNDIFIHKTARNKELTEEVINEIFNNDEYSSNIEKGLNDVWEKIENKFKEELDSIEDKMTTLLEEISNEKFNKMMEISEKYERDLGKILPDVNFKDLNNVNTIVYNQLSDDKQNEINQLNSDMELRKIIGLRELRESSEKLKLSKRKEIEELKNSFTNQLKDHFKRCITPREIKKI